MLSFDYGDLGWTQRQSQVMKKLYPGRMAPVVFGNSVDTVPRFHAQHPEFRCDIVFLDGAKKESIHYHDIYAMRNMSKASTVLFFDEASSEDCVRGASDAKACGSWGRGVPRAYNRASRAGGIVVHECAWPPKYVHRDGVCRASFKWDAGDQKAR